MGNFVKLLQIETIISLGIANAPTADLLENSRGGDQSHEKRISYLIARDWQLKIIIAKCDGNITTCNSLFSLLQSAMDRYSFSYKVRQSLLQSATGITKCDRIITNRPPGITKVIDLLKITTRSTKCDDYYRLPRYTTVHPVDENRAGRRQRWIKWFSHSLTASSLVQF